MTNLTAINKKITFYVEPEIFMEHLKNYFNKDFSNVHRVKELSQDGITFKYLRSIPWLHDEDAFDDQLVSIEITKEFNSHGRIRELYNVSLLQKNISLYGGIEILTDYGLSEKQDIIFSTRQQIGCMSSKHLIDESAWLSNDFSDPFKKPLQEILEIARGAL